MLPTKILALYPLLTAPVVGVVIEFSVSGNA